MATRSFWKDATAGGSGIAKLRLDGRVEASLKESVPQINAPQAWAEGHPAEEVRRAFGVWDQPAQILPYCLVLDASRDPAEWRTSVRTHTAWGLQLRRDPGRRLLEQDIRLPQLGYDVATDLAGDARAAAG
jgi:hypothetical protein